MVFGRQMITLDGDMTEEKIQEVIKRNPDQGMYRSEELNEKLYLHFKGFTSIGGLEKYTDLRVIWLEGNGLEEISGLDQNKELRTLYLHQNCIEVIENIGHLQHLDTLNMSENWLKTISGIENLANLRTLNVSKNRLTDISHCSQMLGASGIRVLDLSNNRIAGAETLDVLAAMPELSVLKLHGNPCVSAITPYRKSVVNRCKALKYLDESPVFDEERRLTDAWGAGGPDAEAAEREKLREEREYKRAHQWDAFDKLVAEAKERKANGGGSGSGSDPEPESDSEPDSDDELGGEEPGDPAPTAGKNESEEPVPARAADTEPRGAVPDEGKWAQTLGTPKEVTNQEIEEGMAAEDLVDSDDEI